MMSLDINQIIMHFFLSLLFLLKLKLKLKFRDLDSYIYIYILLNSKDILAISE